MDEKLKSPEEFGLTWQTLFDDPEKATAYWLQFPLREFVAMIVNESRNNLGPIISVLQLIIDEAKTGSIIIEDKEGNTDITEWLETLIQRGEHLNNILSVMVGYSKKYGKSSDE